MKKEKKTEEGSVIQVVLVLILFVFVIVLFVSAIKLVKEIKELNEGFSALSDVIIKHNELEYEQFLKNRREFEIAYKNDTLFETKINSLNMSSNRALNVH